MGLQAAGTEGGNDKPEGRGRRFSKRRQDTLRCAQARQWVPWAAPDEAKQSEGLALNYLMFSMLPQPADKPITGEWVSEHDKQLQLPRPAQHGLAVCPHARCAAQSWLGCCEKLKAQSRGLQGNVGAQDCIHQSSAPFYSNRIDRIAAPHNGRRPSEGGHAAYC